MKRRSGLRRSELRPDPEKVRDWLRRSRQPLRPGRDGLAPGQRKRRASIPAAMRRRVYQRSGGVCVACAALYGMNAAALPNRRARLLLRQGLVRACAQIHHVLAVQRWPSLELVEDNMVGVCAECHDEHERARRRIPRCALPPRSVMLAASVGPNAEAEIERLYPDDDARPRAADPRQTRR